MQTTSRKPAAARKAEIIETAIRLAGEYGPDRLTTQHLADAIGISQPAVYRHFPNKEAIWLAVANHIIKFSQHSAQDAVDPMQAPAQCLRAQVVAQFQFINVTPAVPAILFSRELHRENEALRAMFAEMMAARHRLFSYLVAGEIESGAYRADLEADDAAYLILTLIQGVAMRWSLNNRAFDLVDEGTRLLDLQLQGFEA